MTQFKNIQNKRNELIDVRKVFVTKNDNTYVASIIYFKKSKEENILSLDNIFSTSFAEIEKKIDDWLVEECKEFEYVSNHWLNS